VMTNLKTLDGLQQVVDFIVTHGMLDDAQRPLGGLPSGAEPGADDPTKNPPSQVHGKAGS